MPGAMFGSIVAEHALIEASLNYEHDIVWDLLDTSFGPGRNRSNGDASGAIVSTELERVHSGRVYRTPIADWFDASRTTQRICVANIPSFPRLAECRLHFEMSPVPICCLVHSLNTGNYFSLYTSILLEAREQDVIVASSTAAHTCLEGIFQKVCDRLLSHLHIHRASISVPRLVDLPYGVYLPSRNNISMPAARATIGISESTFTMLYLGRIACGYKADLAILLQALALIKAQGKDIHLLIAGQVDDPQHLADFRLQATIMGLDSSITIIEDFADFAKTLIIQAANVVISPVDSIQETFGIVILEAMAHAKPVIASSWSGYRDLVSHGKTGFLLKTHLNADCMRSASRLWPLSDPGELAANIAKQTFVSVRELTAYLMCLIEQPSLAEGMGSLGRQRAEDHYDWSIVAAKFADLWREQCDIGYRTSTGRLNIPTLDLNEAFGHFADSILDDSSIVRIAASSCVSEAMVGTFPLEARALWRKISESDSEVLSIGSLGRRDDAMPGLAWLLKKGWCYLESQ